MSDRSRSTSTTLLRLTKPFDFLSLSSSTLPPDDWFQPILWPLSADHVTLPLVLRLIEQLYRSSSDYRKVATFFPAKELDKLLCQVSLLLNEQENVTYCPLEANGFYIVGDLHGQFHDLLDLFKRNGFPFDAKCETHKCANTLKRHTKEFAAPRASVMELNRNAFLDPSFYQPPTSFPPTISNSQRNSIHISTPERKNDNVKDFEIIVPPAVLIDPTLPSPGTVQHSIKTFAQMISPVTLSSNTLPRRISAYPPVKFEVYSRKVLRSYFDVELLDELEEIERFEAEKAESFDDEADAKPTYARARSTSFKRENHDEEIASVTDINNFDSNSIKSTSNIDSNGIKSGITITSENNETTDVEDYNPKSSKSVKNNQFSFTPEPLLASLSTEKHWRDMGWENRQYLFNGDLVDRGAWGVETVITLFAFFVLYPNAVFFNRGNHELATVTHSYGFRTEVISKYSKSIYTSFLNTFVKFPLATVVYPEPKRRSSDVYDPIHPDFINIAKNFTDEYHLKVRHVSDGRGLFVIHGGLFREDETGRLGLISDLDEAERNCLDFDQGMVEDCLWSDPGLEPGWVDNKLRRAGCVFGPDITAQFLAVHGLSMVVRSHEGPDARKKRLNFGLPGDMMQGYSIDQKYKDIPILVTLFSAPFYPQGPSNMGNKGAYIELKDGVCEPIYRELCGAPHPDVVPFYKDMNKTATSGDITDKE